MVIYTYGVFDLLHYGHIRSLKQAKKLGDKLIVGVFTDEVAESFKRKPVLTSQERMAVLYELGYNVVLQEELDPINTALKYGADMIAKGAGAGFENIKTDKIKLKLLDYTDGISTSEIISRLK